MLLDSYQSPVKTLQFSLTEHKKQDSLSPFTMGRESSVQTTFSLFNSFHKLAPYLTILILFLIISKWIITSLRPVPSQLHTFIPDFLEYSYISRRWINLTTHIYLAFSINQGYSSEWESNITWKYQGFFPENNRFSQKQWFGELIYLIANQWGKVHADKCIFIVTLDSTGEDSAQLKMRPKIQRSWDERTHWYSELVSKYSGFVLILPLTTCVTLGSLLNPRVFSLSYKKKKKVLIWLIQRSFLTLNFYDFNRYFQHSRSLQSKWSNSNFILIIHIWQTIIACIHVCNKDIRCLPYSKYMVDPGNAKISHCSWDHNWNYMSNK